MNCRDFTGFLAEYLDGELPGQVQALFEAHIAACPNCHVYLAQYRATVQAAAHTVASAPDTPMPDELVRAIAAALREQH